MLTPRTTSSNRPSSPLVLFLIAFFGMTSSAQGSGLNPLRVTSGDAVVDKPLTVALSGTRDPGDAAEDLVVDINPEGLPCAATQRLNEARTIGQSDWKEATPGAFGEVAVSWTPARAGSFTLCGWLVDAGVGRVAGSTSLPVTVREARTSLAIRLPRIRFAERSSFPVELETSAEVPSMLTVDINAYGVACGPTVESNVLVAPWIIGERVLGGPNRRKVNLQTPSPGRYHLCGYVGLDSTDPAPSTVYDGPEFWAGPAPRCSVGAIPRRLAGKVRIDCSNTTTSVTVTGRRGARTFSGTAPLLSGSARFPARTLGLKRGARVSLTMTVDGVRAGGRIVRVPG